MQSSDASSPAECIGVTLGVDVGIGVGVPARVGIGVAPVVGVGMRVGMAFGVGIGVALAVGVDMGDGLAPDVGVVGVSATTIGSGPDADGPPVSSPSHPAMTNRRQTAANAPICFNAVIPRLYSFQVILTFLKDTIPHHHATRQSATGFNSFIVRHRADEIIARTTAKSNSQRELVGPTGVKPTSYPHSHRRPRRRSNHYPLNCTTLTQPLQSLKTHPNP